MSRPPIAVERLALTSSGPVRYTLKTAYRDGTTHIVLDPLDLMARLAALVPPPRMHLTRHHEVFESHSTPRAATSACHACCSNAFAHRAGRNMTWSAPTRSHAPRRY